jgi:type II secretory ATPase GspE/PulE/Tfp pilus assembly ATPase PilB-like protein
VEQIILQAIDDRATDIHFEPSEHHFKVRYRIDGELFDMPVAKNIKKFQDSIINRIKIMASLDIAQSRLPQDGRILVKGNAKPIDLRVSVLPTPWGEGIEIRILPHKMDHQLDSLGMTEADFKKVNLLIHKPHGIILETGPTGSGKTTTLYTFLNEIKNPKKKIITLEDPIEYNIADVLQIQVNPLIGLDFARGLRSILRHDPNILMVGEIRDAETAAIAIRSSITGHLVFSTLHTNSAVDSIARLMDMGIEPYLIASSLEGVIAQRLVRKICPNCKEEYEPAKEILDSLPMTFKLHAKFYKGKGCAECHFSGFSERTAIFETLVIDNKIKEMIVNRAPIEQIRKYAQSIGMKTLREDGLEKAKAGITTLEEVIRVTD